MHFDTGDAVLLTNLQSDLFVVLNILEEIVL